MTERKLRCYSCGSRKPEHDTVKVSAEIGGDYRRASRRGEVRVCRDCTIDRVGFARQQQEANLNTPVNDRVKWEYAASAFGISISGLRTGTSRRVAP